MSDLDDLKTLFDRWGVEYDFTTGDAMVLGKPRPVRWLEIAAHHHSNVVGYDEFYAAFNFDADDNFTGVGIWK